ncbi:MAG: TolC family protein [Pyrinomonadaceae bacterium]|nr:TolC family protein [Pyrinomonadaceae bacterium]
MKFKLFVLSAIVILLRTAPVAAQQNSPSLPGGGTQQIPGAARVTPGRPAALSFEQAIQLALENNLATLLAHERRNEARGAKQQSLSALLPNVSGITFQASLTENLAALGFQPGIIPGFNSTFVGPFRNFDARVRLAQTIFDLSAIRNYQAGRAGVRVAELRESLAREHVASGTGLIYLEALRADASVVAAQANVELARTLLKLAQDQRNAGVATGVDVTRAQTRLAEQQVGLAQAQTTSEQARLNLQRVVGLPLGSSLTLTDRLRFAEEPLPTVEMAVAQAGQNRREVQVAEERIKVSRLERKAVRSEYLPSIEFVGDYGVSGVTPNREDLPTRSVAIQVNVPIFNGGLTRGKVTAAASRERQTELELSNVRGQVEEDVRLALTTLRTAAVQVRAAEESVMLAERELEMARDRFKAGVGDNLEVVSAQTSLANARDAQVTSLAQHNAARLNLAAALGLAEAFRW